MLTFVNLSRFSENERCKANVTAYQIWTKRGAKSKRNHTKAEANSNQSLSKPEAKPNQAGSEAEANVNDNENVNDKSKSTDARANGEAVWADAAFCRLRSDECICCQGKYVVAEIGVCYTANVEQSWYKGVDLNSVKRGGGADEVFISRPYGFWNVHPCIADLSSFTKPVTFS